jgi:hypothetical protein
VLVELNIDVTEDIKAAIITAIIKPRAPVGNNEITNFGYLKSLIFYFLIKYNFVDKITQY